MRLQRDSYGREMYRLIDNENQDDELLEVVDDYEQRHIVNPPYTWDPWKKLTLIAT